MENNGRRVGEKQKVKKWNGERKMRKRKKKGRKINQREKLNHDKVICGREGDITHMSRKSFQWESRLQWPLIKVKDNHLNMSEYISQHQYSQMINYMLHFQDDLKKRFEDIDNQWRWWKWYSYIKCGLQRSF